MWERDGDYTLKELRRPLKSGYSSDNAKEIVKWYS